MAVLEYLSWPKSGTMPRRIIRLIAVLSIFFIPPVLSVLIPVRRGWLQPKMPGDWFAQFSASFGLCGVFCAFIDFTVRLIKKRRKNAVGELSSPEFPYEVVSASRLASRFANLSHSDIPYVPRLPEIEYTAMLKAMHDAQNLLIIGRTGLGKTREAIELVRQIEAESGEEVSVLVPEGVLDVPHKIPGDRLKRLVVLFIDNLPSRYSECYRTDDVKQSQVDRGRFSATSTGNDPDFSEILRNEVPCCRHCNWRAWSERKNAPSRPILENISCV